MGLQQSLKTCLQKPTMTLMRKKVPEHGSNCRERLRRGGDFQKEQETEKEKRKQSIRGHGLGSREAQEAGCAGALV